MALFKFMLPLFGIFYFCNGHTYHLGGCPITEPLQDFDMKKLLGTWYAIEKTSTASSCVVYNFKKTDEPYEYELVQTSQHFGLSLTPLNHVYKYTGQLHVSDISTPSKMVVKFPLNVGSSNYTILKTDYTTYALIYTCQKLAFVNRQSATILSREKTLDKSTIKMLREELAANNIDPHDLSIISQSNCPKQTESTSVINIDDETLSAKSAGNAVKKAGEKLGQGVEYVAGGIHKLYEKTLGDDNSSKRHSKEVEEFN